MTYIYWDKREVPPKEIFRCNAEDILKADKKYTKVIGKNPGKQPYIGCESVSEKRGKVQ